MTPIRHPWVLAIATPSSQPPSTLGLRVLGGTLKVSAAQALLPLTGIVTAGVLTRFLGADGYGHFSLAASLVAWLEISVAALLGNATVHWVAKAKDRDPTIRAMLRLYLVTSLTVAAACWLLAPQFASIWREPHIAPTLRLLAFGIPIACMARGYGSVLAGQQFFSQQALAIGIRLITRLILTVALVGLGFSIRGAIFAVLGAATIELLVASRHAPAPALLRSPTSLPDLLALAGPIFLSAIAIRLLQLDLFLLKAFGASLSEAGLYAAAHNLALAPIIISTALATTILATLTRARIEGEQDQAQRVAGIAIRVLLASLPCAALLSGSAPQIVSLVYGTPFANAGPLFAMLIFSSAGLITLGVTTSAIVATGTPRLALLPVLPVVPPALLAYAVVVPSHGPTGAAAVTTAAALIGGLLGVFVTLRSWQLRFPFFTFLRSVLFGALAFWASRTWVVEGPWLIAKIAALVASVPLGYVLAGELSSRDHRDLRELMLRWRSGGTRD